MLFKQSRQFLLFVNLEVYPKKKEMRDKIMSKMKIKKPKLYMVLYKIMETSPNQIGKTQRTASDFSMGILPHRKDF